MRISFEYNGKLKERAKDMRQTGNLAETLIWDRLKNKKLCEATFCRQKVIGSYIADFCCETKKIVIEIDGSSHDAKIEYDNERDKYLEAAGFEVIRISADDVLNNMIGVVRRLEEVVKNNNIF